MARRLRAPPVRADLPVSAARLLSEQCQSHRRLTAVCNCRADCGEDSTRLFHPGELCGPGGAGGRIRAAMSLRPWTPHSGVPCVLLWVAANPALVLTHVLQLARVVYAHGNDNQKGQAMLCSVYFRWAQRRVLHPALGMRGMRVSDVDSAGRTGMSAAVTTWARRCIRDDFYGARDMLLMSRIQEQTGQLDAKMQVERGTSENSTARWRCPISSLRIF